MNHTSTVISAPRLVARKVSTNPQEVAPEELLTEVQFPIEGDETRPSCVGRRRISGRRRTDEGNACMLVLRALHPGDEAEFRAACRAMDPETFSFAFEFDDTRDFQDYLRWLDDNRAGLGLEPGRVPSTYLIAEVDGEIVGRVSIRHHLTDSLLRDGGHIGYGVLPHARRRGHATEMLRLALVEANKLGIARALLTCDEDNAGSIRVIERCGGERDLDERYTLEGMRRYWIPTG